MLGVVATTIGAISVPLDSALGQASTVPTSGVIADAPLFGESAIVLPRSGAALGGSFAYIFFDEEEFLGGLVDEIDVHAYQLAAGGAVGITGFLTVGAAIPYLKVEVEAGDEDESLSGFGDMSIAARGQFLRTSDGASSMAALAGVTLPTASGDFEADDGEAVWSLGLAGSHSAGTASLHGGIGIDLVDDFTILTYSLSTMIATAPTVRVGLDLLGSKPEDFDNEITLGGGLRWLASENVFLDGGVLIPVTEDLVTAALVAALTWHN
jgi:hypothetical protein